MQHVFQHHDRRAFEVHIFSLSSPQECPEVQAILQGVDCFSVLSPKQSSKELAGHIQEAGIDILVDLCGYTGTSRMAEILSHRPVPLQIAYMGFPASSGASYVDYMIVDDTVVPPSLRPEYTEGMIFLPHSYFVNSHATGGLSYAKGTQAGNRSSFGLPEDGMIFCCHSRSDKLDPDIFDLWVDTIVELRESHEVPAILWLLRSCPTMERNLRQHARKRSLPDDALIFCDVVPRSQHLQRLAVADVFLDTPAYNAHTVGCDTLHAGTPMISLLLEEESSGAGKMASRVGASLLRAAGLEELVATSYGSYKSLMMKCALDQSWFSQIAAKLKGPEKASLPLFDTKAWVGNLDRALLYLAANATTGNDINVESIP
jgi:protein O-GlcNAc transferase